MKRKRYEKELVDLEFELAKLQESVVRNGLKVAILFEGRDAAGKGGTIKTLLKRMSNRVWRVAALPKPSDVEKSQWYFQRYVAHLPSAAEIVLFDRSWYNRGLIEPVMGFCTPEEHALFLREAPAFERMLARNGVILLKYWLHVSAVEQEKRFQERACDARKRWKLRPLDLEGRRRWAKFSERLKEVLKETSTDWAPWRVVDFDCKRKGRLNLVRSILDCVPYDYNEEAFKPVDLPPRQHSDEAADVDAVQSFFVKDYYA